MTAPLRRADDLDGVGRLVIRSVAFSSPHQAVAATLWVAHTHVALASVCVFR